LGNTLIKWLSSTPATPSRTTTARPSSWWTPASLEWVILASVHGSPMASVARAATFPPSSSCPILSIVASLKEPPLTGEQDSFQAFIKGRGLNPRVIQLTI
jgi:hypothetical protein